MGRPRQAGRLLACADFLIQTVRAILWKITRIPCEARTDRVPFRICGRTGKQCFASEPCFAVKTAMLIGFIGVMANLWWHHLLRGVGCPPLGSPSRGLSLNLSLNA